MTGNEGQTETWCDADFNQRHCPHMVTSGCLWLVRVWPIDWNTCTTFSTACYCIFFSSCLGFRVSVLRGGRRASSSHASGSFIWRTVLLSSRVGGRSVSSFPRWLTQKAEDHPLQRHVLTPRSPAFSRRTSYQPIRWQNCMKCGRSYSGDKCFCVEEERYAKAAKNCAALRTVVMNSRREAQWAHISVLACLCLNVS